MRYIIMDLQLSLSGAKHVWKYQWYVGFKKLKTYFIIGMLGMFFYNDIVRAQSL